MLVRFALALGWSRLRALPGRFRVPPAEVRRDPELRALPDLATPYYAARGSRGIALVPKDRYLTEVETLLKEHLG